ncbi:MAG: copper-binding protein [Alphaproteobacteria bacterium]|nr:copper-binding protein [Alphaproteobacteria bacterium]
MTGVGAALAALVLIASASVAQAEMIEGQIRRIDPETEKLTIRHGPIARLDMPAMTMVFRLARPELMRGLAVGDRVLFDIAPTGGAMTIVEIRKAP